MKSNLIQLALLIIFATTGCSTGGYTRKQAEFWNNISRNTIYELEMLKKSGDPDYDFATMMQIHHRAGIAMAEDEIRFGMDSSMVNLAKQIKVEEEKDDRDLSEYLIKNSPMEVSNEFEKEMQFFLKTKSKEVRKSIKLSGIIDKDFANNMITNHLQAMEMASIELKYGRSQEVKSVAERILDDNEKELDQLRVKSNSR